MNMTTMMTCRHDKSDLEQLVVATKGKNMDLSCDYRHLSSDFGRLKKAFPATGDHCRDDKL